MNEVDNSPEVYAWEFMNAELIGFAIGYAIVFALPIFSVFLLLSYSFIKFRHNIAIFFLLWMGIAAYKAYDTVSGWDRKESFRQGIEQTAEEYPSLGALKVSKPEAYEQFIDETYRSIDWSSMPNMREMKIVISTKLWALLMGEFRERMEYASDAQITAYWNAYVNWLTALSKQSPTKCGTFMSGRVSMRAMNSMPPEYELEMQQAFAEIIKSTGSEPQKIATQYELEGNIIAIKHQLTSWSASNNERPDGEQIYPADMSEDCILHIQLLDRLGRQDNAAALIRSWMASQAPSSDDFLN